MSSVSNFKVGKSYLVDSDQKIGDLTTFIIRVKEIELELDVPSSDTAETRRRADETARGRGISSVTFTLTSHAVRIIVADVVNPITNVMIHENYRIPEGWLYNLPPSEEQKLRDLNEAEQLLAFSKGLNDRLNPASPLEYLSFDINRHKCICIIVIK